MFKTQLEKDIKTAIGELGFEVSDVVCSIPKNSLFGDYTTNIPLQLAKHSTDRSYHSPMDIASGIRNILEKLTVSPDGYIQKIETVEPGFINIYLNNDVLIKNVMQVCDYFSFVNPSEKMEEIKKDNPQKILIEYAQPNTHKAFHIGHTRNITLGESVSRLLEAQGHEVFRCTYGSDIGLPVAKAIWGVMNLRQGYKEAKKADINQKAVFLGQAYAKGALAYEADEEVKGEIDAMNKQIYEKNSKVVRVWEETRNWSLQYLDAIYQKLGSQFNGVYIESQVETEGKAVVEDNIGNIFETDNDAVIFPGVKYGLHNRVFITSQGNPTYEAKELGLAKQEYEDFNYDLSYHLVATEQSGYFQVIFKVIDLLFPELAGKKVHLAYEMVDLKGRKMSSRTGDVITFDDLLSLVKTKVSEVMRENKLEMSEEEKAHSIDMISIGAIKFTMLKYSFNTKIIFDLEKSVALDGDSGPYLQYTYARAKSVLRSAIFDYQPKVVSQSGLEKEERQILQQVEHFTSVVSESANNLNPTILATFLLETAKLFNNFYQKYPILKAESDKIQLRLALTCSVAVLLKKGLYLLGIDTPERM